jgi:hypothetical protein
MKYAQLNSDAFTRVVNFDWDQMVHEYGQFIQVGGRKDASIYDVLLTLRHFERLVGPTSSREITQQNLEAFVLKRSEEVGKNTLNKDVTNLRVFLDWAVKNRFVPSGLEIRKVKVPQKPVVCPVRAARAGSVYGSSEIPNPTVEGLAGGDNVASSG